MKEGTSLHGKSVSDSEMTAKVIDLQAKLEAKKKEVTNLRKDRDELLSEHQDLRKARYPQKYKYKPRHKTPKEFIRVMVGDVHGMLMDKAAVNAFLNDLKDWSPTEIVLGGDILECGGWLAKHQPIGFVALCDYSYQEDIIAGNWFLDEVQKAAPNAKIYYIEGNHEDRVERGIVDYVMAHRRDAEFLCNLYSPQVLLNLAERGIEYFRRSINYVDGAPRGWIKLGKCFFTHTLGTGKNAANASLDKAAANVVYFCTHRADSAVRNLPGHGLVAAHNPGCMCSLQPVWKNSNTTNWSHGYAVQFVAASGAFQHVNIPIDKGVSLVGPLLKRP